MFLLVCFYFLTLLDFTHLISYPFRAPQVHSTQEAEVVLKPSGLRELVVGSCY